MTKQTAGFIAAEEPGYVIFHVYCSGNTKQRTFILCISMHGYIYIV